MKVRAQGRYYNSDDCFLFPMLQGLGMRQYIYIYYLYFTQKSILEYWGNISWVICVGSTMTRSLWSVLKFWCLEFYHIIAGLTNHCFPNRKAGWKKNIHPAPPTPVMHNMLVPQHLPDSLWASTTIKIMVDPIWMIKTLRVQQWWLYFSTHCFNGGWNPRAVFHSLWSSWWVIATHLKNMLVKLGIFSPRVGVKIKHLWNHHLVSVWCSNFVVPSLSHAKDHEIKPFKLYFSYQIWNM